MNSLTLTKKNAHVVYFSGLSSFHYDADFHTLTGLNQVMVNSTYNEFSIVYTVELKIASGTTGTCNKSIF